MRPRLHLSVVMAWLAATSCAAPPSPRMLTPARPLDAWAEVACGASSHASPIVDAHCTQLANALVRWRRDWNAPAAAYFAAIRPPDLPSTVVYPFGGGDLLTALTVFPDAELYVTISLERANELGIAASDVRLHQWLERWRARARRLLRETYNTTRGLEIVGMTELAMLALVAHACTPSATRAFSLDPDGTVRTVASFGSGRGVEVAFGCRGRAKIWRHVTADLAAFDAPLAQHLHALGDVTALVKASGFLLWQARFGALRDYLLTHARWIVSDSSGVHPDDAAAAHRRITIYGTFQPPFEIGAPEREARLRAWSSEPAPPFRFGYGSQLVIVN